MFNLLDSFIKTQSVSKHSDQIHFYSTLQQQRQSYKNIIFILQNIFSDDTTNIKFYFEQLSKLLKILQGSIGPKAFDELLNSITISIYYHVHCRIIKNKEISAILILTYFQRQIKQFIDFDDEFNDCQKKAILEILNIWGLLHLSIQSIFDSQQNNQSKWIRSADQKIVQFSIKLKKLQAISYSNSNKDSQKQVKQFSLICNLMLGISQYLKQNFKEAKNILLAVLDQITTQPYPSHPKYFIKKQITIVCLFYLYSIALSLQKAQFASYYINKAFQILSKQQKYKEFCEYMENNLDRKYGSIRLNRIQQKFEKKCRQNSLKKPALKQVAIKLYQKRNRNCTLFDKQYSKQLQDIMIVKDKKATSYKLKKQNLNYLMKQQKKQKNRLQTNKQKLSQLYQRDSELKKVYKITELKQQLQQLKQQQTQIDVQYQNLKYANVKQLWPVKKIQKYFKAFQNIKKYKRKLVLYDFVYGNTISKTVCIFFMLLMKKKIAKQKRVIKYIKVKYGGLLHFIQIYEKLPTILFGNAQQMPGFYFKIYPIELNKQKYQFWVEDQVQITFEQSNQLQNQPFYYIYTTTVAHKLLKWNQYMKKQPFQVIYNIKKFIKNIKKTVIDKQKLVYLQKRVINFKFPSDNDYLRHIFILQINELNQQETNKQNNSDLRSSHISVKSYSQTNKNYLIQLYSISNVLYKNPLYNIKINKEWISKRPMLNDSQISQIYLSQLYQNFSKNLAKITTIQKICRSVFSKKIFINLRKNAGSIIKVIVHGNIIYTYRKQKSNKPFLTIYNLKTKEVEIKESDISIDNFSMIDMIRKRLESEPCCKKKMRIILNFIKIKSFIKKIKQNLKKINKKTSFQRSFQNRLIFYQMFDSYIYRNKKVNQKIMFTLIVKSLIDFPRPYRLRIFTITPMSQPIDVQMTIYNEQQNILLKTIQKLNMITNIVSKNRAILPISDNQQVSLRLLKRNSRYFMSSINSLQNSRLSLSSNEEIERKNSIAQIEDQQKYKQNKDVSKDHVQNLVIVKKNTRRSSLKRINRISIQQRTQLQKLRKNRMSELSLHHSNNSGNDE